MKAFRDPVIEDHSWKVEIRRMDVPFCLASEALRIAIQDKFIHWIAVVFSAVHVHNDTVTQHHDDELVQFDSHSFDISTFS